MSDKNDTDKKGFSITWILENFPYFGHKRGQKIVSPAFIVNTIDHSKWGLWVYPRGEKDENCMSYYLFREEDSKGPACMKIDFELSFFHADGSPVILSKGTDCSFLKGKGLGWRDVCKRKEAIVRKGILQNNLTVRCTMWKTDGKVLENGICFARTRMGVEQRTFVWKIDQFTTLQCNDKVNIFRIKSASTDELIMTLNLFWIDEYDNFGSICMDCVTSDREISLFTLKIVVLDAKGGTLECGQDELWFDSINSTEQLQMLISKQQLMSQRSLYVPKDVLTLHFKCSFSNKVVSEEIEKFSYGLQIRDAISEDEKSRSTDTMVSDVVSALKTDLSTLFDDRTFCDVKVYTKTVSFYAHWLLLSARSPVFRAMYGSDMKEKAKGCITIPDTDADTVRRMLKYIYTDSFDHVFWDDASRLYVAADKYAIQSLKRRCSDFLKDNLCQNNACEILALADMHNDDDLKIFVQDFILNHDRDILKSKKWKLLMETNSKLAADTMFLKYRE